MNYEDTTATSVPIAAVSFDVLPNSPDNRLVKSRFDKIVLIPSHTQNRQHPHGVDSLFGRAIRPLAIGRRLLPVPKDTARDDAGSFTVHKNTL